LVKDFFHIFVTFDVIYHFLSHRQHFMKHSRKKGRFARANLTDNTNELTFLNFNVNVFEANNFVEFSSLLLFFLLVNSSLILLK
jgi:hypothetical protein